MKKALLVILLLVSAASCLLATLAHHSVRVPRPTQETPSQQPSERPAPTITAIPNGGTHDCARLRYLSYLDLFDYWTYLGSPSDMDLDLDGVPCEENFNADTR